MNKPKAIGTAAETQVVKYLRENGFSKAERRALHGGKDVGDILACDDFLVEVKVRGKDSSNAGLGQPGDAELLGWLDELDNELWNAGCTYGLLVVKRKGTTDVAKWWGYVYLDAFTNLLGVEISASVSWVCMEVAPMVELVKNALKVQ